MGKKAVKKFLRKFSAEELEPIFPEDSTINLGSEDRDGIKEMMVTTKKKVGAIAAAEISATKKEDNKKEFTSNDVIEALREMKKEENGNFISVLFKAYFGGISLPKDLTEGILA